MFSDITVKKIISVTERENYSLKDVSFPRCYLTYKVSGSAIYSFPDADHGAGISFRASGGDIVLIPAAQRYSVELLEEGRYYAVGFTAADENAFDPIRISGVDASRTAQLLEKMKNTWLFRGDGSELELKGLFYQLLALCARGESAQYCNPKQSKQMREVMKYLKAHIFDSDLSVQELSRQAGVSEVYFRKLFRSMYNTTPSKYIINSRILYARSVLQEDSQIKISQLSEMVGYTDPFYFSKLFKQCTGISPQQYRRVDELSDE